MKCHDCGKTLKKNQEFLEYAVNISSDPLKKFIKCKRCHQKDSVLRNYYPTEVYSRVVGYIRPISQWNLGKKEEFKDRKTFKQAKK